MAKHNLSAAHKVNLIVANLGVLNVKLHQYHWFVQGPHFEELHVKFEELYTEAGQDFDTFAERLIVIGKKPYATLQEFIKHAHIREDVYNEKIPAEQMVENIVEDYRTIRNDAAKGIDLASNEGDAVTEDMLVAYKNRIDQHIWMLQAFLGKDALESEI